MFGASRWWGGPVACWVSTLLLSGCGSTGRDWVAENPHGAPSAASDESSDAPRSECRVASLPPEEEEPEFERPRSISLGMSYVEDGQGRVIDPSDSGVTMFEKDELRSFGYGPRYYGGYGYGYYGGYYGGFGGYGRYGRPGDDGRPSRPSRPETPRTGGDFPPVPNYGPPMMDKTLPAPVWR
ncbi:MAG TPA: hypothetical protein VLC09_08595 [Polyangiaceae bacterium]|nr:hypothetical protein [Polyangiaceae bacterium]